MAALDKKSFLPKKEWEEQRRVSSNVYSKLVHGLLFDHARDVPVFRRDMCEDELFYPRLPCDFPCDLRGKVVPLDCPFDVFMEKVCLAIEGVGVHRKFNSLMDVLFLRG